MDEQKDLLTIAERLTDNQPFEASCLRLYAKSLTAPSIADSYAKFGWTNIVNIAQQVLIGLKTMAVNHGA